MSVVSFHARIVDFGRVCITQYDCKNIDSCPFLLADVTEVPFQTLRDRGFRGVIFDKDNTLTAPHELEIASHLKSSLAECRRVFGDSRVVIFSNSAGSSDDTDGVEANKIEEKLHVAVLRHSQKV